METKFNEVANGEHEVEVILSYDEIKSDFDKEYTKERKNISLDGFRKGKAPMGIIKKMYGEAIEYKASEEIAQKKFMDVVKENNLKPISTPKMTGLDYKPGENLTFKIKYEVFPTLELNKYKGLVIEKPKFNVKEEHIEKDIDGLMKSHATFEECEKATKDCRITVDLQRLDENGVAIIGSRSEGLLIDLSEENVNKDILENSLNKKVGDKFVFSFVDEHKHGEETHKETYTYDTEIKKIEKIVYPEITEELVKKMSSDKSSTLDEFKKQIRNDYENYFTSQADSIYTNSLISKIIENNEVTPSEDFVNAVLEEFLEREKQTAAQQKKPFDENAVRSELKPKAEWNAKWRIVADNIARIENIKVEVSEFEKMAEEESASTGISVTKLIKYYKDSNREDALIEEKVMNFLKVNNKAKEFDPEKKSKKEDAKK